MISIIITAYKEEKTIGRAIEALLKNNIQEEYEILVLCPDKATKKVVEKYTNRHKVLKYHCDSGVGKPAAINKALLLAEGDKLVLTDGDVYVSDNAVDEILKKLEDKNTGTVTARPVSISPRNTMLGFWSHLLTDAGAHLTRLENDKKGKFVVVSGYLFAMKRLFDKIPEDALADDCVMSQLIWQKGYRIGYAENALVYVKYPASFEDWILQKRRTIGGDRLTKKYFGNNIPRMRSFKKEVFYGTWNALTYPKTRKEFLYTLMLFPARFYLWVKIYNDLYLRKIDFHEAWKRIETTK